MDISGLRRLRQQSTHERINSRDSVRELPRAVPESPGAICFETLEKPCDA